MLDPFIESPALTAAIAAFAVVLAAAVVMWLLVRRRRSARLERRFGAEYQRKVDRSGSRREAEQALEARRRHREQMTLQALSPSAREELRARFEELQTSFVDAPEAALRSAHHLLAEVAALRGYRPADGESRLEMASADHPEEVAVHERNMARLDGIERISTEELRQSVLAARRLFESLVRPGEDEEPDAPRPPHSLLGLGDHDEVDGEVDEQGDEHDGAREGDARTISTRPDDDNRVRQTIDVTVHDRGPHPPSREHTPARRRESTSRR